MGRTVTILEAGRLLEQVVPDPASHLGTALRGWEHPVTRDQLVLMDLYDRFMEVNRGTGPKPKPYPRPWAGADVTTRTARNELTQEETLAALRYAGHTNLPTG